jgi:hypothetical protein
MAQESNPRPAAMRVAKALRDKGRGEEALLVLCAWAASGPNDPDGQALLAEALRLDPDSPLARMAFERMEGISGDQAALDQAIARFPAEDLARIERELRPPVFQRAQVGFNNNVKYKGKPYHVQTEDSGLTKPHVITHLFADGGRIIKSHKRSYADAVSRDDVAAYVRALMKGQHIEMLQLLREGRFDPVIDGERGGGMEVLEHPPAEVVERVGGAKRAEPARPPSASAVQKAVQKPEAKVRFTLHVLRSPSGGPERYDPPGDSVIVGALGAVNLPGERFCHPREAVLSWDGRKLWIEDLEGGNGVFLRIKSRVEIAIGDEFAVGDQLLRVERNPDANDGPGEGPTYFLASLTSLSSFRVVQVFEGGALGACARARDTTLQIGSVHDYANDMVLARDALVEPYHCVLEEQAEALLLADLGTASGVFVRVRGRQALVQDDELLVGRTRLRVDLTPSR